ncbi:hypothetical protein ACET9R_12520 [Aeromonas veronii]
MIKIIYNMIKAWLLFMLLSHYAHAAFPVLSVIYANNTAKDEIALCGVFKGFITPPLSVARTLIVDDKLPLGSVLYSWQYSDFIDQLLLRCPGSSPLRQAADAGNTTQILFNNYNTAGGYFETNNPGIGLRLYYKVTNIGSISTPYLAPPTVISGSPAINSELPLNTNNITTIFSIFTRSNATTTFYLFDGEVNNARFIFRGELIKIGTVSYTSTPLAIAQNSIRIQSDSRYPGNRSTGTSDVTEDLIGSGGIQIIKPICRLTTPSNYNVNFGRWIHRGAGSSSYPNVTLPAYGNVEQINVGVECSSQFNVEFAFQDTGSNPLSNGNVSLYDTTGNIVSGMEVEISNNGTPIHVNKISDPESSFIKANVGTLGTLRTNTENNNFDKTNVVFGARLVQRNSITYTGPIAGTVNMFVTYN